jgi:hypothetical protein
VPCDIVLLPAPDITERAITLSRQLQNRALFVLSEDICVPHVSLYMTQIADANMGEAKKRLAEVAAKTSALELAATAYCQAEGYIDVEYTRTDQITALQMAIIDAINPIRDAKDKALIFTSTDPTRENLEKYGYGSVGDLFRPHLTFIKFADDQLTDTSELPKPKIFSGKFARIGLFEMGDYGTCARKIAEFGLGADSHR